MVDRGDVLTRLPIKIRTREKLKALGRKGETYEDILKRLISQLR